MAEKQFKSRIQLKNDTEARWSAATSFIPKLGEAIIYNPDSNYIYPRIKIGDGETPVTQLPFLTSEGASATSDLEERLTSGALEDAELHLGFYLDEDGDLCQIDDDDDE